MPKNWAFDQFHEYTFSGFGLDKDAVSGRDNGVALHKYNRGAARAYMDKWWDEDKGTNPDYYYYPGNDCANFVSQCIHAGGWSMRGTSESDPKAWFSKKMGLDKHDENYDKLSGEEKLEYDITNDNITATWSKAKTQYNYFNCTIMLVTLFTLVFAPTVYANSSWVWFTQT